MISRCFGIALVLALTTAPLRAQQLQGKGEWQSSASDMIKGTWSVTLVRAGGQVNGSLQLTGSNVFSGGAVTGTIDQSSVVLGVVADGLASTTFAGKLDGASISGEWQSRTANDSGVWYGTLSQSSQ